jgi:glycosyltransferase involved in cell wall biosynthesis
MWKEKSVSVVLPTYNEKASIAQYINDLFSTGIVDEVIAVNNNAAPGTDSEILKTRARLIHEPRQGYGHAIQRGLREASGDLLAISEPDGTFVATDITKLLAYTDSFDMVLGSRTLNTMIWAGANMGAFLRHGNFFVAKMIEVFFNTTTLSDVGCTFRLMDRPSLEKMTPAFTIGGSHFGLEMMLIAIEKQIRFIQIPVNYQKRVGVSSVTGDRSKTLVLGFTMIGFAFQKRLESIWNVLKQKIGKP